MNRILFVLAICLFFFACKKNISTTILPISNNDSTKIDSTTIDSSNMGYIDITKAQINGSQNNNGKYFTTYFIKSGNNFCEGNTYPFGSYGDLHFSAILDSSCIYANANPSNQADINKLFGYADCSSHHHTNSARFGWNWYKGAMRIHAYCYSDSVRTYREIGTVKVNEEFDCKLVLLPNKYIFSLNGDTVQMDRHCTDTKATGYLLYPYFGGNEPAPQDIRVKIKEY